MAFIGNEYSRNSLIEDNHYIVTYTRIPTDNHEFYHYMEQFEVYGGRRTVSDFNQIILKRFHDFSDLLLHFNRRITLEKRISKEILFVKKYRYRKRCA